MSISKKLFKYEPIDIAGAKKKFCQFADFDPDFYTHNITEYKSSNKAAKQ